VGIYLHPPLRLSVSLFLVLSLHLSRSGFLSLFLPSLFLSGAMYLLGKYVVVTALFVVGRVPRATQVSRLNVFLQVSLVEYINSSVSNHVSLLTMLLQVSTVLQSSMSTQLS
jgi:hypothetical protein